MQNDATADYRALLPRSTADTKILATDLPRSDHEEDARTGGRKLKLDVDRVMHALEKEVAGGLIRIGAGLQELVAREDRLGIGLDVEPGCAPGWFFQK